MLGHMRANSVSFFRKDRETSPHEFRVSQNIKDELGGTYDFVFRKQSMQEHITGKGNAK